jgi:hypothetical protein
MEGRAGMALGCDGVSAHFEVPHAPDLDPPQLTVEAWIRLPEFPSAGDTRRWVVNKNDDEWTEGHYGLVINADRAGAYLNIGGGQVNTIECFSEKPCLKLDTWQHLAFTYDGSVLCIYCDGSLAASRRVDKPRVSGTSPLDIGRRQDAYNYLLGAVDEVRLYTRALSADEITAHARDAESPAGDGLAGQWSFEDLTTDAETVRAAIGKAGPG